MKTYDINSEEFKTRFALAVMTGRVQTVAQCSVAEVRLAIEKSHENVDEIEALKNLDPVELMNRLVMLRLNVEHQEMDSKQAIAEFKKFMKSNAWKAVTQALSKVAV